VFIGVLRRARGSLLLTGSRSLIQGIKRDVAVIVAAALARGREVWEAGAARSGAAMNLPTTADLLDFATHLAWTGGRRTLAYFNCEVPAERKADGSPVTIADKEAEATMRALLAARFPDHGVVGEEHGEVRGNVPIRWIIDPIDGTRTFLRGVPFYGTLVGVEVHGEPTVGVIYIPALDEMVAAGRGLGCSWNGRACRVAPTTDLSEALVVATDETAVRRRLGPVGHDALVAATAMQRTWADCYGYVLVATGRSEVARWTP